MGMITPGDTPIPFRLREPARQLLIDRPARWGHTGLSEVTYRRTYSRTRPDGTSEDWGDTVVRVVEGMWTILRTHASQNRIPWDENRAQRLATEAGERLHSFKWTPPGRGLWVMGTDHIFQKGGMALNNCAFVSTKDIGKSVEDALFPFTFVMDTGMLGVGPGFDTKGAGKIGVQGTDGSPVPFVVPDTREGWVSLIETTIRNHLFGGPELIVDVSQVRPPGSPLRGFGGKASGPEPLVLGYHGISDILRKRRGQDIRSTDITDMMNLIGKLIVSGDVRSIAEIGFGQPGDMEFASMKNWEDFPVETGNAPPDELYAESEADYYLYKEHMFTPHTGVAKEVMRRYIDRPWAYKFGGWRWASNNSLLADVGCDYTAYDQTIQRGDLGFVWLETMRAFSRLKDPPDHKDHRVLGANPCAEQSLESGEVCNLVENYPAHAEAPLPREAYESDRDWNKAAYYDFQRTLKFSYLYAKTVTLMGTHIERTNEIVMRNRRIGCSMSGVVDATRIIGRTEFLQQWCDRGYGYVTYIDKKYSDWLGVRESIKRTSNKPSGTVSLVAGVFGPGVHYPKATGYRTMRLSTGSDIVPVLLSAGYRVEPSVTDPSNKVVAYFPWIVPEGTPTEDDVGLWEQVKMAADMQYWWADNQVSYTATFTQAEADRGEIPRVLTAYDGQLKGISFLKKDDTAYAQMPFSTAPREEVEAYAASLKPLIWDVVAHEAEDRFCDGATCMVA